MGSVFFQIAMGLIPVTLVFLLFCAFSKKHRIRNVVLTGLLVAAVGGLFILSLINKTKSGGITRCGELGLVYAIAAEGSPKLAESLLGQLRAEYRDEYALAAARLAVMTGDYPAAKAMYLKAGNEKYADEYNALLSLCSAESQYYGLSDNSSAAEVSKLHRAELKTTADILDTVFRGEVPESGDNVYGRAADYIVYADAAHQAYLTGEPLNGDEIRKKLRGFNSLLEENPEFLEVAAIRLARLKLQLLCEEYKQIAGSVSDSSDYNELLIVSELYLNNYVKKSDFNDEFADDEIANYKVVYEKLGDIYNNRFQEKPREERNAAKAQLKALSTILKNPALGKIERKLAEYAETEYAFDASKVYLQMAKIEHSLGNELKSSDYIDRSIDTVGDCGDSDYTAPMYELVGIISDKDNPERLKSAAVYVEQVIDNSMTIKMVKPESAAAAEEDGGESLTGDFASRMQTYVNQKRMSVKIVNVDTTDFEKDGTVKATVNISNSLYTDVNELKAAVSVMDCGVDITDFTVEKVNYTAANILLCVDVSGSMSDYGKIGKLRDAIKQFAAEKADIENIALVTFNNRIVNDYVFGVTAEELKAAADNLRADGGTDMYHALIHSLSKFTKGPGVINAIILMSDGLDGYGASIGEIEEYIGKPANAKEVTVYSIGFGSDADGSYLNSLAAATGGTYLYANEPTKDSQTNQLGEFFSGLRAQVLNQYIVTFKAKDTLSYSRELKITVGDGLDSDKVTYYLGGGADSITEPAFSEDSPVFMDGKAVYGFEPRLLLKNGKTLKTVLKGEGFAAGDNIRVSLKGKTTGVEWEMGTSLNDAYSVSVTLPAGIGIDVYDAYVTVNGKTAVLTNGLSIFTQGSEKITEFGKYRFISYIKQTGDDSVTLSGNVTMNGWLGFIGDVTLSGSLSSGRISLTDWSGSSVQYDPVNSEGLAKVLGKTGLPVVIPPLGQINLYNDSEYEKQTADTYVEAFPLNELYLGKYFGFTQIEARLYPNRASFETGSLITKLPYATRLLNKLDIFTFDVEAGVTVSSKKIGCMIDLQFNPNDTMGSTYWPVSFGNMPIYISPRDTAIHIDTIANDYELKFAVKLAFLEGKLGLQMKWDNPDSGDELTNHSNGLVPTAIKLFLPGAINTVVAGVPITFDDFFCGIDDIDTSKNIKYWTLAGGFDVSVAKLSAIPGFGVLKDWIGDVSAVKLDNVTLSLNLGESYFKADADVKLFEELDMGNMLLEIGKFPYTCRLLGIDNEPVAGFRYVGTYGPDWEFGENSFKAQVTGEVDLLNRFFGFQGRAEYSINFKTWFISIGENLKGEFVLGVRITSDGTMAFVIRSNPKLPMIGEITIPKNVAGKL